MGADVKQSGEAFGKSAAYLRWQDKAANQKFFTGEHAAFSKEAADLLLEIGIIKAIPDMSKLADPKFVQQSLIARLLRSSFSPLLRGEGGEPSQRRR